MEEREYLVFTLSGQRFAVPASRVRMVCSLPELSAVAENRAAIVGTLDLRGNPVPIADGSAFFTGSPAECRLSDRIIVLDGRSGSGGLIVSEIEDTLALAPDGTAIDPRVLDGWNSRYIEGIARQETGTIFLLDGEIADTIADFRPTGEVEVDFLDRHGPNLTESEREILRQRAERLRGSEEEETVADGDTGWIVVGLQGKLFGISLDNVREFTEIKNLYPLPCCPGHIVGQTNLRGEIVTLIDIRPFLDLPLEPVTVGSRVMIVESDGLRAGLPVSEVIDTVYLSPEDEPRTSEPGPEYLRGSLDRGGKTLTLLDLSLLLQNESLVVNEKV